MEMRIGMAVGQPDFIGRQRHVSFMQYWVRCSLAAFGNLAVLLAWAVRDPELVDRLVALGLLALLAVLVIRLLHRPVALTWAPGEPFVLRRIYYRDVRASMDDIESITTRFGGALVHLTVNGEHVKIPTWCVRGLLDFVTEVMHRNPTVRVRGIERIP